MKPRSNRTTTAAIAALALAAGVGIGYTIGRAAPAPAPVPPAAQSAPPAATATAAPGTTKDAAGVEATIRDEFATLYQGDITKEQWTHYCADLITAESRAHVNGCKDPKDDYMGHRDEIRRIEDITIDGDSATASVGYHNHTARYNDTITEHLQWEDGRWKLDSRMRNDKY